MKDNYGDEISVDTEYSDGSSGCDEVYLYVSDSEAPGGPVKAQAALTPKKARRLAAKLLLASYEAEANGG